MNRRERLVKDQQTRVAAALGVVFLPGGGPEKPRAPARLEDVARRPWLWGQWLGDAMLRKAKGFRLDKTRRMPPEGAARWRGERRKDKPGTSKLSRALLNR